MYVETDLNAMMHIKVSIGFQSFHSVDDFCRFQVSPNKLIPARFDFWAAILAYTPMDLPWMALFISQNKIRFLLHTYREELNFSSAILNFIAL